MAYRCVRLAAAGADAVGRDAGNTCRWFLAMAKAQRWDSGVMLILGSIPEMLSPLARYGLRMMTGRIAR